MSTVTLSLQSLTGQLWPERPVNNNLNSHTSSESLTLGHTDIHTVSCTILLLVKLLAGSRYSYNVDEKTQVPGSHKWLSVSKIHQTTRLSSTRWPQGTDSKQVLTGRRTLKPQQTGTGLVVTMSDTRVKIN